MKKKFLVSVSDYSHYLAKEIEAENQDEASKIYMEMVASGDVEVVNSDYSEVKIKKLGEIII